MNVSITPELERKIAERVAAGGYESASDLVDEALRHFFEFEEARQQEVASIAESIEEGWAQLERGEGIPGDEARCQNLDELRRRRAANR
jgi:antitoxin ParD1/3/4